MEQNSGHQSVEEMVITSVKLVVKPNSCQKYKLRFVGICSSI